jgi:hypothetical protein
MTTSRIAVGELKRVSILYNGDFYELALWLLRADDARSSPASWRRHTVNGVAGCYAHLTEVPLQEVRRQVEAQGIPLGATVEHEDDATSPPLTPRRLRKPRG